MQSVYITTYILNNNDDISCNVKKEEKIRIRLT